MLIYNETGLKEFLHFFVLLGGQLILKIYIIHTIIFGFVFYIVYGGKVKPDPNCLS